MYVRYLIYRRAVLVLIDDYSCSTATTATVRTASINKGRTPPTHQEELDLFIYIILITLQYISYQPKKENIIIYLGNQDQLSLYYSYNTRSLASLY